MNIRHLMGDRTEKEVGDDSGVGQTWLNRVLNPERADGIRSPGLPKLRLLADYFGVPVEQLLSGQSPARIQSQPARLDEAILADALAVIRGAAEWQGEVPDVSARAIALAYALLEEAGERVSPENMVRLVKAFMAKAEGSADAPA